MAEIFTQNLESGVVKQRKLRTKQHYHLLPMEKARKISETWHKRLSGKIFTESTKILREDRSC